LGPEQNRADGIRPAQRVASKAKIRSIGNDSQRMTAQKMAFFPNFFQGTDKNIGKNQCRQENNA